MNKKSIFTLKFNRRFLIELAITNIIIISLNLLCLKDTDAGIWLYCIMPLFIIVTSIFIYKCTSLPIVLQIIISSAIPFLLFYATEMIMRSHGDSLSVFSVFETLSTDLIFLNIFVYYLIFLIIFFVSGRLKISLYIYSGFCFIIGVANYFVILFRSSPIVPADIYSIGTATNVADNYKYTITPYFVMICYIFIFTNLFARRTNIKFPILKRKYISLLIRAVSIFSICIALFFVSSHIQAQTTNSRTIKNMYVSLFTPLTMVQSNGYMVTTIYSLQYLSVNKPIDYSSQNAEKILSTYSSNDLFINNPLCDTSLSTTNSKANIIIVMNECYSDLSVLGDLPTNQDFMPFTHRLMEGHENTMSGYLYSSVIGGNTANTEFEFLTGNTMAFLPPGSVPYQQFINKNISSLASSLSSQGYYTAAAHPYKSTGWKRDKIYPLLGFNNMFFENNMPNIEYVRTYASDSSFYDYIKKTICTPEHSPYFSFNVTMQNHSGFGDSPLDDFTADISTNNFKNGFLNNYLSLMKISDKALEKLVNYYSTVSEPTLIVMFGDHQPNDVIVKDIYTDNGIDYDSLSDEQKYNRYKVPLIVWANYDIPENNSLNISSNYLGGIVTSLSGNVTSQYQNFLEKLRLDIPVLTTNGFLDSNGNYHSLNELEKYTNLIDEYKILQYYNIFG